VLLQIFNSQLANIMNSAITNTSSFLNKLKIYIIIMFSSMNLFGQADGYTYYYYENGKTSSEGYMQNGKPNKYWKTYHPNGVIKSEGNRKDFLLDSIWKFYDDERTILNEITYYRGKKNGVSRNYKSGVLFEEFTFKDDIKVDTAFIYFPTGELKQEVPFENGKENGNGFEYDAEGRIITLLNYKDGFLKKAEQINRYDSRGKKRGIWINYHRIGIIAEEGTYMNDKKNGIFKYYDRKGELIGLEKYRDGELVVDTEESIVLDLKSTYFENGTVRSTGGYVDGKKEGTHRTYNEDGSVSTGEVYKGGLKVGEGLVDAQGGYQGSWKLYYPTGELKAEGAYENSNRTGDWIFYHPTGKIEHKAKYLNGLPHGPWKWYYENGVLRREESFRRGKEEGVVIEYDLEGNIVTQGNYISGFRDGEWFYHVGDHIEKGTYRDGERTGQWIYEFPDEKLNYKGSYVSGLAVGKHKWYHPNGQLRMDGKYSSGVRVGTWRTYDEQGVEFLNIKYKNGIEVKINGKKVIEAEKDEI
jgi:antitoxin component YwqK of YwqJK toxin-antitoxin module